MPAPAIAPTLTLSLDREVGVPLQDQIMQQLRSAILSGRLKPGMVIPSTRALARDIGVARQTVVAAYERLEMEGYLEGRAGSATRISTVLPELLLHVEHKGKAPLAPGTSIHLSGLSRRGAQTAQLVITPARPGAALLAPGVPALDEFPFRVWERLSAEIWRSRPIGLLGYAEPGGHRPLREAIAAYLGQVRGLACDPSQVLITSGSQQGIDLACHLLADPGDEVWVEDPGYIAGRHALKAAGLRTVPVAVDSEGLDVVAGETAAPCARLAFVTPSHQYPLGVAMSLRRRSALLDWAERADAWIVEDDYDSEFRYSGQPLQPIAALARNADRVLFIGTFSKLLAPGLRLGYLVAPSTLVQALTAARALADRQPRGVEQAILAEFMARGYLAAHVRRMRGLYKTRRDALIQAVAHSGEGLIDVTTPQCGLHAIALLPADGPDDAKVYEHALRNGLQTPALSAHYANHPQRSGLLLGFAGTPAERMVGAVQALTRAVRSAIRVSG